MCVTWLMHVCDMTHSCVWHDSFMCVTWLIHVCDMTHSCVWLVFNLNVQYICNLGRAAEAKQLFLHGMNLSHFPASVLRLTMLTVLRCVYIIYIYINAKNHTNMKEAYEKDQFLFTYISPVSIDIYEYIWRETGKREVASHLPVSIHTYIIYMKRDW